MQPVWLPRSNVCSAMRRAFLLPAHKLRATVAPLMGGRVAMNVQRSEHLTLGESVDHYHGDELVVDTIGFSDKTLLDDSYSVPHTTQLHVIERFELIDDGKTLEVNLTVDDPGVFNLPGLATPQLRL
jgi:hypothetical protein